MLWGLDNGESAAPAYAAAAEYKDSLSLSLSVFATRSFPSLFVCSPERARFVASQRLRATFSLLYDRFYREKC